MPDRRSLLAAPLVAIAIAWGSAGTATAEPVTITFLHTNDVYEIAPKRGRGGLAELGTLLRAERARSPHTITTFGGDLISPSVLSGITKGEQMIELYNALGTQIAVPGNHEFDFGAETARARFAASRFPWLGTNLLGPDGKPALGTVDLQLKEIGGFKIGFFGLVEPETPALSSPGRDLTFADPIQTATKAAGRLKEMGADLVVALTHLDFAEDREVAKIRSVDLVLGGHDHDPITWLENGKLIVKAGYDAHWLAAVDLRIERVRRNNQDTLEVVPQWRYLTTAGVAPDPEIRPIVEKWNRQLDEQLAVAVGRTRVELDTRRDTVRTQESNFGNLIADAIRNTTGADVAIVNGGGIRGDRIYAAGAELTRKDILTELPFGNVTVLIELKGSDLLAALEHGVSQVEQKGGRFPQVSGLSFRYDPSRPAGSRVVSVAVGGQPLDLARIYKVVTNDFMLGGGDGYAVLKNGKPVIDASGGTLMASTVMNYITAAGGEIAPTVEGRITKVD